MTHHTVLIVGGGAAGVSVANNMRRQNAKIDIAIIEPSEKHYYQPGFTIIGGGAYTLKKTTRNEADLIHPTVKWIKEYADTFQPEANTVTLRSGEAVSYDYLVVCPGLQLDWDKIAGLKETIGKNNVCSNYSAETVEYTWECIQSLQSGTALFTQPPMPIKCAGAPQKIMYLAADRFRRKGILDKFNIEFCNAGPALFGRTQNSGRKTSWDYGTASQAQKSAGYRHRNFLKCHLRLQNYPAICSFYLRPFAASRYEPSISQKGATLLHIHSGQFRFHGAGK